MEKKTTHMEKKATYQFDGTNKESESSANEDEVEAGYKPWVSIVTVLFFIIIGSYFLFMRFSSDSVHTSVAMQEHEKHYDYSMFVVGWNDKVRNYDLSDAHLLSSVDDHKMLRSLKAYLQFYSSELPESMNSELEKVTLMYPTSIFKYYKDFLHFHLGKHKYPEGWENAVDSTGLFELIKKTTGNRDVDESLKLILASSDPCAFFSIYKYELRSKGLSANLTRCTASIIDAKKYPSLATLIR